MSETQKFTFKNARQVASEGSVQSVLAEIYHIGEVETPFGIKDRVKFIFEITETRDGTDVPLNVSIDFNNVWSRKSSLYGFVEKMLGRQLTVKEAGEFDPSSLIGKNSFLTLIHKESNGKIYANIKAVMPLVKGMPEVTISEHYVPFEKLLEKWRKAQSEAGVAETTTSVAVDDYPAHTPSDSAPSNVAPLAEYTV